MNPILTPESICELDTFTLEEKIEQLDANPDKELYAHIIQIAKLELIDRLEIEEFGRQLANDEYKLDLDFNLPNIVPKIKTPGKVALPPKNKNSFIAKLHNNMVPAGSFVTVGRPAVSHHYKPKKIISSEINEKPKTFLKARKGTFSKMKPKGSMKPERDQKVKSNGLRLTEVLTEAKEFEYIKGFADAKNQIKIQKAPAKVQFSLKDKLKQEVQQMKVDYRQNDAYDDMRIIKMSPLNLKDQQKKILQDEPIESVELQVTNKPNESLILQFQAPIEMVVKEPITEENKVEEHVNEKEKQIQTLQDKIIEVQGQSFKDSEAEVYFAKQELAQTPSTPSTQYNICEKTQGFSFSSYHTINQEEKAKQTSKKYTPTITLGENFNQSEQPSSFNKEAKSKSVKNFTKKVTPSLNRQIDNNQISMTKLQVSKNRNSCQSSIKRFVEKQEKKTTDLLKFRKTGFDSIRLRQNLITFPYNQVIGSFHKLFPHSKNMLITLRNVEDNLRQHFDKGVNQKSLMEERKVNETDMTFRVISQSEKAKKYSDLFNINLQSFHRRGRTMLSRLKKELDQTPSNEMLFYRVVRTKEEVYDIINSSFYRTTNWYELPHGLELKMSWNLLWTWSKPQIDFQDLFYFQKVNHFIGNKQIARKDLLKKNIEKIQKLSNKMKNYFDIIPETFLLPGQNIPFIKKFRQNGLKDPLNYWILKPVGLSRGRGISLINKLEDVVFSQPIVLQKYIMNPLLVDSFKFDMRIYVLVTSMNPLQAFIYHQGFARLSTQAYSDSLQAMENKFIHLTNFSIQRENLTEEKRNSLNQNVGGSKISLQMLSLKLQAMGIQWNNIEKQIQDIVLKSLISCMNAIPQNPNCFQLFGYDIFIDTNQKCWLLQVNSSPSLQKQYTLDQIIKQQLVDDIVQIVNPLSYDRQKLLEVIERRRKEAEGLKSSINTNSNSVQQLNQDLHFILKGQKLRKYGQTVNHSNFKMIAPSDSYHKIIKTLQQYKIDPIVKNET